MTIDTFLLLLSAWIGAAGPTPDAALPDASKMNILFINIEDCEAGVWGCYGDPICKTPNIDRLASTGVRFDSAYCQAICCNPTRTSFLTGLRPRSTRVLSNGHIMNEHLPAGVLPLPEMLKNRGVYTAVIGKLFHKLDYAERQLATFDRIEMYARPRDWKGPDPILQFPPLPRALRGDPAPKDQKGKAYRQWRARRWGTIRGGLCGTHAVGLGQRPRRDRRFCLVPSNRNDLQITVPFHPFEDFLDLSPFHIRPQRERP